MPNSETNVLTTQLDENDLSFWEKLEAEIETPLDGNGQSDADRQTIVAKLEARKKTATKADLYELDRLNLEIASPREVIAQAPDLYRKYCQERGLSIDANDLAMKPPAPSDEIKMKALRARMLEIIRALHWSYTFGPRREQKRIMLIQRSMYGMAAATIIMGAAIAAFHSLNQPFFAMLVVVVYAGVMGGAVSCLRRLGDLSTKDDALGSISTLENSSYVLIFAPMTGAVFAVVAMLLFMGELMTGPLFPSFASQTAGTVSGGWSFLYALLPKDSKAYALLFLWCFISGFAERFIPDTLDGLTKRAAMQKAEAGKEETPASH